MARKKPHIAPFLYENECSDNFAMIPPDLFESSKFQALSNAARTFYLLLVVHQSSQMQRSCLHETLLTYNDLLQWNKNKEDINLLVWGNKRTHTFSDLFVIPSKQLKVYGYSDSYATKLKKELLQAGFIKEYCGGKGRYTAWSKNVTIYQFSNKWKK